MYKKVSKMREEPWENTVDALLERKQDVELDSSLEVAMYGGLAVFPSVVRLIKTVQGSHDVCLAMDQCSVKDNQEQEINSGNIGLVIDEAKETVNEKEEKDEKEEIDSMEINSMEIDEKKQDKKPNQAEKSAHAIKKILLKKVRTKTIYRQAIKCMADILNVGPKSKFSCAPHWRIQVTLNSHRVAAPIIQNLVRHSRRLTPPLSGLVEGKKMFYLLLISFMSFVRRDNSRSSTSSMI